MDCLEQLPVEVRALIILATILALVIAGYVLDYAITERED